MITCPDCHAVVNDAHEECPVCGGPVHASEEQRAIARIAEAERSRSAQREAADAIAHKDRRDHEDRSRFSRLVGDLWEGLDDIL